VSQLDKSSIKGGSGGPTTASTKPSLFAKSTHESKHVESEEDNKAEYACV
jgi:hypothetical protein